MSHVLQAQEVVFSSKRGFYQSSFQLSLSTVTAGATIRYTLDGTTPTTTVGTVYSSPVTISTTTPVRAILYTSGGIVSKVFTHTYIFIDNVVKQPKIIAGWPNKTYDIGSGDATAVHDYEMSPTIVNSSTYGAALKTGLMAIPTMSIVMDKDKFWETYDSEPDIENPASVEVIYPDDVNNSEQVNAGLEPHSHKRLKRSMRLKFKAIYGDSKFNTKLLTKGTGNTAGVLTSLDGLVLRAGNNRSWARNWNPDRTCYTRDEWYRQSQFDATGMGGRGTFVHLYVNGLYWGLYNPVERPDAKYSSAYFGGSEADWFAMNHDGAIGGDATRYNYLLNTLTTRDMTIPANYDELKQYLDVEKFSDYLIVTWMMGMTDWPSNNHYGGNRNNPAGPFRFYAWDGEWSFDVTNGSNEGAWVHPAFRTSQTTGPDIAKIWIAARKNPDFMAVFADRVQKLCFNNGALTDANSVNRWLAVNNLIKDAIIAESARWGDALNDGVERTKNGHWQPEVTRVQGLMNGNVTRFITALRGQGYYPSLDAPVFSNNGGNINAGTSLSISNPNSSGGTIYYTTNGVDPRTSGGGIASGAIQYSGSFTINSSVTVKARVKNGTTWSALREAAYNVQNSGLLTGIFINEFVASNITYLDEFGDKDDWIEIYNSNSVPVNIGGLFVTDLFSWKGQYKIPTSDPSKTTIPAKGYLLLWADGEPAEGILHITPKLSNNGERIGLYQLVGTDTLVVDTLSFGIQSANISMGRFPDGSPNLVFFNPPTPKAKNAVNGVAGLFINEFIASNVTGGTDEFGDHDDWFEIYNSTSSPIDIGGLYVSDNLSTPGLWQIPTGNSSVTTVPAKGFLRIWADGETAEGPLHVLPKFGVSGEQIGLFQKFGTEFVVVDSLTFKAQSADISQGRYPDGSKNQLFFNTPTPLAANVIPRITGLKINEFMASNTLKQDEAGEFDDWFEIYNSNNFPVNAGGLFITDNLATPAMYQIPTNDPGKTTIPAKGFLLLWADKQTAQGALHVDVKFAIEGEAIGLVQQNGSEIIFIDSLTFGAQVSNVSTGRFPDGSNVLKTFSSPTPGLSNGSVVNNPPIVNAGPDVNVVSPANSATLTATASDPDGDVLTFRWRKVSGPALSLSDSSSLSVQLNNLLTGKYTMAFTATDSKGASKSDTAIVNVSGSAVSIVSLSLINADTDQEIKLLKDGDTINIAVTPRVNVRANTSPSLVGSVLLKDNSSARTENTAPYSLKGDNNGDFNPWTPTLGLHTISATPYTLVSLGGTQGATFAVKVTVINNLSNSLPVVNAGPDQTLTLPVNQIVLQGSASDPGGFISSYKWTKELGPSATMTGENTASLALSGLVEGTYKFRLTVTDNSLATAYDEVVVTVSAGAPSSDQKLVSFTLINADTDTDIKVISNGEVLNLAKLPTKNLNIRANTSPSKVGSVVFNLNGKIKNENTAPYSLKGDNNGDYVGWIPSLGDYVLTGSVYSLVNGGGIAGTPLTVTFKVINDATAMTTLSADTTDQSSLLRLDQSEVITMNAYPNPFSESTTVEFTSTITQRIKLEIYDLNGNLYKSLYDGVAEANMLYKFEFSGAKLKEGQYISRLSTNSQVWDQKLLLVR
jgi:hypothetical protein